jgi:hypothetical protein
MLSGCFATNPATLVFEGLVFGSAMGTCHVGWTRECNTIRQASNPSEEAAWVCPREYDPDVE